MLSKFLHVDIIFYYMLTGHYVKKILTPQRVEGFGEIDVKVFVPVVKFVVLIN